jgi:hypothetical protein
MFATESSFDYILQVQTEAAKCTGTDLHKPLQLWSVEQLVPVAGRHQRPPLPPISPASLAIRAAQRERTYVGHCVQVRGQVERRQILKEDRHRRIPGKDCLLGALAMVL